MKLDRAQDGTWMTVLYLYGFPTGLTARTGDPERFGPGTVGSRQGFGRWRQGRRVQWQYSVPRGLKIRQMLKVFGDAVSNIDICEDHFPPHCAPPTL
jgi:hypothetical protein